MITVSNVFWAVGIVAALSVAGIIYAEGNSYHIVNRVEQSCVVHWFQETCYDKRITVEFTIPNDEAARKIYEAAPTR